MDYMKANYKQYPISQVQQTGALLIFFCHSTLQNDIIANRITSENVNPTARSHNLNLKLKKKCSYISSLLFAMMLRRINCRSTS
jgi:hypothetical protein